MGLHVTAQTALPVYASPTNGRYYLLRPAVTTESLMGRTWLTLVGNAGSKLSTQCLSSEHCLKTC